MLKKKLFIISISLLVIYLIISFSIGNSSLSSLKNILPYQTKQVLKEIFFPYKIINERENDIKLRDKEIAERVNKLKNIIIRDDISLKKSNKNIVFIKHRTDEFDKFSIDYFKPEGVSFKYGITNLNYYGSAYLDYYKNKIFLLTAIGITGYSERDNNENIVFNQIPNNIENFINENQFYKSTKLSVKDLKIFDEKVFVSLTNEMKNDCWNTIIIYAELNFQRLNFKELFDPKECVSKNNEDGELNFHQTGGRIVNLNKNNILLTVGDYRYRKLAQQNDSYFGKIIKINLENNKFEIFSKGHRNIQGLYFDKSKNIILATEHGPKGGDEINIIKLDNTDVPNYGWPISSYGEHYKKTKEKIKKYPLLKSHKDHGFIEPIKYFTPSIGISEITKVKDDQYIFSSLRAKSIYFFNLDKNNKFSNLEKVELGRRIRDVINYDEKILLFLEGAENDGDEEEIYPNIALIDLKSF